MRVFSPAAKIPRRRATATVELAVLLPFLCFCFVVAIDYARIFYVSLTVNNCARNGAAYGSQDAAHALDTTGITTEAKLDASNLTLSSLTISSTTDSSTNPTWVEVTASYPFTTITHYMWIPASTTVTRIVRMQVVPATPSFN